MIREMGDDMKKYRFFWTYQHEEEEKWLNDLSKDGLHLSGKSSFLRYNFENDPGPMYVYRLDYNPDDNQADDLIAFYKELGWDSIAKNSDSWYYFRKAAGNDADHQLYSDSSSRIELFKRIRNRIGLSAFVLFVPLIPLYSSLKEYGHAADYVFLISYAVFLLFAGSITINVIYKFTRKIGKIKEENI